MENLNTNAQNTMTERYIMFLILCGHDLDFIMQETAMTRANLQMLISAPLFKTELHNLLVKIHRMGEKHLKSSSQKAEARDTDGSLVRQLQDLNITVPSEVVSAIKSASKILDSHASASIKNQTIRLILDFYSKVLAKLSPESDSEKADLAKIIEKTFREEQEKFENAENPVSVN